MHGYKTNSAEPSGIPVGNIMDMSGGRPTQGAKGIENVLDLLRVGCVMLGTDGRALFANRLARELLSNNDILSFRAGLVTAISSRHHRKIRYHYRQCVALDKQQCVALDRDCGGRPVFLSFLPLQETAGVSGGRVVLFICDLEVKRRHMSTDILQEALELTPTEASVAIHLCDGLRIRGAANALGISVGTARNHLKRIFSKLGVSCQSELVMYLMDSIGYLAPEAIQESRGAA